MKARRKKKAHDKPADPEMRAEYDFSRGVRGKYARRYAQGVKSTTDEHGWTRIPRQRSAGGKLPQRIGEFLGPHAETVHMTNDKFSIAPRAVPLLCCSVYQFSIVSIA
jgi:hypothetical protein